MRLYRLMRADGAPQLVPGEAPMPEPGPREVRVRIEAVSLNYRDLIMLDQTAEGRNDGLVPVSDGAGRVDAIGPDVTRWQVGDRVCPTFFRDWVDGPFRSAYQQAALGARRHDGVLRDHMVVPEHGLVAAPSHLTAEEASTLPCAAVTAWQALVARGHIAAGDTLLVQGTGGVALFGLQFAVALGARAIVISSSDEKLARAEALGATGLVNYRKVPDWDKAVRELTGGTGASHVLELGGPDTYDRSLSALADGGRVMQIGVLTGFGPRPDLLPVQRLNADIIGITVGSAAHFEAMNAFISEKGITPVIDRVFPFEEAPEAYAHLREAGHFGKVVIKL